MRRTPMLLAGLVLVWQLLFGTSAAHAEAAEVRVGQQPGLGLLPLFVVLDQKLIEKHARSAGLGDVRVTTYASISGQTTNDALISGAIDVAVTGSPALITIWDKTFGTRNAVKGMMSMSEAPLYFNSIDPALRTIDDVKDGDKIALTAVSVSGPAYILQIYAAGKYGWDNRKRFDPNTVSMSHPDAMAAMLTGKLEVKTHAASLPFLFQELKDPRVHTILNSYDVSGGPQSFAVAYATERWRQQNPKLYRAVFDAFVEATELIKKDASLATDIYMRTDKTALLADEIKAIIAKADLISYKPGPTGIMFYADYMFRSGAIKHRPDSWKDVFFEDVHAWPGD